MTTPAHKADLRIVVRERLSWLYDMERLRRAARLPARMREVEAFRSKVGRVMGYLAMSDELDVSPVFWLAWSYGRGVCVPHTDWERNRIVPVGYTPGLRLTPGRFGVPEVSEPKQVTPSSIAIVLVPGVAFDDEGRRLGRGGGFYDRFLERLLTLGDDRPAFVGVCFEEQRVDEVPVEEHDVRMDAVLSV